ncbi:MAG: HAD family phosphatase [Bdellovibrionales bacterium]|jgi:beta-phosphoglucomutase-like phosphatase (HAD superfamily)
MSVGFSTQQKRLASDLGRMMASLPPAEFKLSVVPPFTYDFSVLDRHIDRLDGAIFDLDGTLVVNNESVALDTIGNVHKEWLEATHGITDTRCYRCYAGMPLYRIRKTVGDHFRLEVPQSVEDEIMAIRKRSPLSNEPIKVHPFFKGLLDYLDNAGVPMCIATGSEPDRALRYVEAAGLKHYFDKDGSQWLFCGRKPDPKCYHDSIQSLAARRGITTPDPRRYISFEDSVSGVAAGVRADVNVLGHLFAEHISPSSHAETHTCMMAADVSAVILDKEMAVHAVDCVIKQCVPPRKPTL